MALINIQSAIKRVRQIVGKLEPPQGVEILTYKRNRGINIIKIDDEQIVFFESWDQMRNKYICLIFLFDEFLFFCKGSI